MARSSGLEEGAGVGEERLPVDGDAGGAGEQADVEVLLGGSDVLGELVIDSFAAASWKRPASAAAVNVRTAARS
ncbi:hypothetical protein amrb99_68790 [Actinomadura sp. RB99]|uniref:hypothetical protein n=1 Tax=Actinomadura sp. RB99 TaxID=2691577 RepID=UPI0019C9CDA2|nr:hypothetical protein [Actinomadura sp. RB99]MBD2897912.1 hypothetical protein [Actinomadura sp. RB99]